MPSSTSATPPNFSAPIGQLNPTQVTRQQRIGAAAQTFLGVLTENCPTGYELEAAIEQLRVVAMWANQAIIASPASKGAST